MPCERCPVSWNYYHEWCPESNGYVQGSQKGGARYKNYCRKSLQAWRRDLKELVPELLRALRS